MYRTEMKVHVLYVLFWGICECLRYAVFKLCYISWEIHFRFYVWIEMFKQLFRMFSLRFISVLNTLQLCQKCTCLYFADHGCTAEHTVNRDGECKQFQFYNF